MSKNKPSIAKSTLWLFAKSRGFIPGIGVNPWQCVSIALAESGHPKGALNYRQHCESLAVLIEGGLPTAKKQPPLVAQPIPASKKRSRAPRTKRPSLSSGNPHRFFASVMGDGFLSTYEWRRVRMVALKKYGPVCQCCGATPATGAVMNVDHIKPRRIYPELALEVNNLQILCHECNHGKGNWDMTDWRPSSDAKKPLAIKPRTSI